MDTSKFKAIKETFPWKSQIVSVGAGGLIKIIDKNGREVDLMTIVETIVFLSEAMAKRDSNGRSDNGKHP